ncbi:MAG: DUF2075 domain-containing protein [Bacilli bacterium]|nr:DUF2075 domain-containing protein [Bacilli bacterium]
MIVYSDSVKNFCDNVTSISDILNNRFKELFHKYSNSSEIDSWKNSLKYFSNILSETTIPNECTITLEYNIPLTSNRIDLILTGFNNKKPVIFVFEFKQWQYVNDVPESDYLVQTILNGNIQEVVHPGYQVWSYSEIIKNYNEYIQINDIEVNACLLMHNYIFNDDDVLLQKKYEPFMKNINYFGSNNIKELIDYLNTSLTSGDKGEIISNVDNSKIKPSFKIQTEISHLIGKNKFFNMIDQQIVVYDKIMSIIKNEEEGNVIIVKGRPGTGKSIIAINLLNSITNSGKTCQYVSRNTAPRVIYSYTLKGELKKTLIDYLFKSSGSYTEINDKSINTLIVDEAHCLTEKSGLFNNYGINQIMEIIKSSKNSVFFIDELQQVHLNDIGTIDNIKKIANNLNYKITELSLDYQFRCNGSDEYLSFVDYILGLNDKLPSNSINYDFKIIDSPNELFEIIKKKNEINPSRLVAGYCWNWNKKEMNNTNYHDIKIGNFEISWNLGQNQTFAIDDSINEAGCVHSVQGLEFDYVGVIIGKDVKYKDNRVITDYNAHGSADPSFKGIKKMFKSSECEAKIIADKLIKNAYRVLLTRGAKGCYIYCQDEEYREFIKNVIKNINFTK